MPCGEKSEPIVLRLTRCREAAVAAGDDLLVYLIDMAILHASSYFEAKTAQAEAASRTTSPAPGGRGRRRAAIEGEWRGQHPTIADRHKLPQPVRVAGAQDRDWVGPKRRRAPQAVRCRWDLVAKALSNRDQSGHFRKRALRN
jgi:hypothetical protein